VSNLKFAQLADAFDAMAEYIDQSEGERLREKQAAVHSRIDSFAERYLDSTGEELPPELRSKLASLDEEVLESVLKTTKTAGGSPDSLGGPADNAPNLKTASEDEDADARMLRFLTTD